MPPPTTRRLALHVLHAALLVAPVALSLTACFPESGSAGVDSTLSGGATDSGATETTWGASASHTASASASASESGSGSSASDSTAETPTTGLAFDVGFETTTDGDPCGQGGEVDFSHIWIANSDEGTVSKIDTQTIVELGRYQVRPQGYGQPSRTSVNLAGDVAVASRLGGVAKILARTDECVDDNNTPGIQTSSGADDVLPWGVEECVAWYTDFEYVSERAIAWTAGQHNEAACVFENAKVWVGGTPDQDIVEIVRLNGDTGAIEEKIQIPNTTGDMTRSPYGGAVDRDGNFWTVNAYCNASLINVRIEDMSYEVMPLPEGLCAYGITVDAQGRVWIGGYNEVSGRYDPDTQTWAFVEATGLGIQEDAEGRMWMGAYLPEQGVYAIDSETMEVLSYTDLPTTGLSKGVSIDFYGYVWVVSDGGDVAVRMDPDTFQYKTYDGLNGPYSYSDMTGWGLKNVIYPPG